MGLKEIITKKTERLRQFRDDMVPVVRGFVKDVSETLRESTAGPLDKLEVRINVPATNNQTIKLQEEARLASISKRIMELKSDKKEQLATLETDFQKIVFNYDPNFDSFLGSDDEYKRIKDGMSKIIGGDANVFEIHGILTTQLKRK